MGREEASDAPADVHASRQGGAVEKDAVLLPEAERHIVGMLRAEPVQLELALGHHEGAALDEVAVDALRLDDPRHLVHRRVNRALERKRSLAAAALDPAGARPRDDPEHPAAVAARGAEARHLALQHDDLEGRVGPPELVRGPQARIASADDADVRLHASFERRPRRRHASQLLEPEGDAHASASWTIRPPTTVSRTGSSGSSSAGVSTTSAAKPVKSAR